ncbi:hypothetical protein PG994_008435 [Apiospora phragmitis]|uniref:Uncharacterized protein n=1 Tax=Apiospora phragmitis TaxID=2905665 RepID=A0ABR1UGG6_9PEZI
MATHDDSSEVDLTAPHVETDFGLDSGSNTGAGTPVIPADADYAMDHPVADPTVDPIADQTVDTAEMDVDSAIEMEDDLDGSNDPVVATKSTKRTNDDPDATAGPATKRQKKPARVEFPTIKSKHDEKQRRKKLMAAEVDSEYSTWEQANETLSKKKKAAHKKEITKSIDEKL